MKRLIVFLLLLVLAIFIGLYVKVHPGYVLINTGGYVIETRFWVAVFMLLAVIGVAYYLIRSVQFTRSLKGRYQGWRAASKRHKALQQTQQGLTYLVLGDWKKAEKLLQKQAKKGAAPLLNFLGAAMAAQKMQAFAKRDQYLLQAVEVQPDSQLAIGRWQAKLQYEAAEQLDCLQTCQQILAIDSENRQAITLLAKAHFDLSHWAEFIQLLPHLQKYRLIAKDALNNMMVKAYQHALADAEQPEALDVLWQGCPKLIRENIPLQQLYVTGLLRTQQFEYAEQWLRKQLKKHWSSELVALYGNLTVNDKKQLATAEAWLKQHDQCAQLCLTLAKLSERNQLPEKAKRYYEQALTLDDSNANIYAAYANFLELSGESKESLAFYRKGLRCLL